MQPASRKGNFRRGAEKQEGEGQMDREPGSLGWRDWGPVSDMDAAVIVS